MNTDSPDALWQQMAPVLDDSIESLDSADRQAILLRFFERQDFRTIGATLGVSDDAAQKRVSRALEKLRELLAQRGITMSLVLLGSLMAGKAVKAAPPGLAATIAGLALASVAAGGGFLPAFAKLANSLALKLALGGIVAATAVWLLRPKASAPAQETARQSNSVTASATTASATPVPAQSPPIVPPAATTTNATPNQLTLTIVTADTQQAAPDVVLDYWLWANGNVSHKKPLQATSAGTCNVPVPEGTTELILVSEQDGFADTRLDWRPDRGETIPARYTLRLARAVPIGGLVVDPDGHPVTGAQVGFNNQPDAASETRPQSDDFGWPFWITATTDAQGRWQINRMSKEAIKTIYGGASHPDYVGSGFIFVSRTPEAEGQLLAGTNVFTLGRAVTVLGTVEDADGQPVPGAEILVGHVAESGARETTNQADGTFSVAGCQPGKNLITAKAKGYAPTSLEVNLADDSGPFRFVLQPGKLLKLQVVDNNGNPIPKATVWLNTFGYVNAGTNSPPTQVDFNRHTDANGCLEWEGAPDGDLAFDVAAAGYMRINGVKLQADGTVHTITLQPGLTISGTVSDATTGQPIPRFRVITGWPVTDPFNHTTNAHWSTIDRFWMSFTGGKFQQTYEEPVVGGVANPEFVFKFEAQGYAPFVTRAVAAAERNVQFDVALTPASAKEITVVLSDGTTVPGADIGLVTPGAGLHLEPGGFSRDYGSGGSLLLTDNQGRFQLPADPAITRVIAASRQGYAEATPAQLASDPVLWLQPWGRLEGTCLTNGQPAANMELSFQYSSGSQDAVSCDAPAFQTKSDSQGHFVFAQVPPGNHQLSRVVRFNDMGRQVWTDEPLQPVTIRPGETTTITVGN